MENKVVFAGLLHDIGKLIQRAEGINKSHSLIGVHYLNKLNNELLKDKFILNSIEYHHAKNLKDAELDFEIRTYYKSRKIILPALCLVFPMYLQRPARL